MIDDKTIDLLDHLVRINRDAEASLRAAGTDIRNSELESLFSGYAKQHAKFVVELRAEIERLGGRVTDSEKTSNAFERGWKKIEAALAGGSQAAILGSCKDAEETAHIAYQDATDANPAGHTHGLIEKQWKQIQGFRTHLSRLVIEVKDGVQFPMNE